MWPIETSSLVIAKRNGRDDMEFWVERATDYRISKAPDVLTRLRWSEVQTRTIPNKHLDEVPELRRLYTQGRLHTRPGVLSHHVWGLLSPNLEGQAWYRVGQVPLQHRLEVCRIPGKYYVNKTTC